MSLAVSSEGADVVLIGAGTAGVSFLASLARKLARPASAVVIDEAGTLGRGQVFGRDAEWLLMNTPSDALSLVAGEPDHFLEWAAVHADARCKGRSRFVPRATFGEYIQHVYQECHPRLSRRELRSRAVRIVQEQGGWMVTTESGQRAAGRCVVLATGPLRQEAGAGPARRNYIACPFPAREQLARVPEDAKVLVLGTSLSAVDTVISLREQGHRGAIVCASRRGRLPEVKGPLNIRTPVHATYENFTRLASRGELTLRTLLREVRREFAAHGLAWRDVFFPKGEGADGHPSFADRTERARRGVAWFDVVVGIQLEVDRAWRHVARPELDRFFSLFYPALQLKHGAIPLINADKILEAFRDGQLAVRSGFVSLEERGERFVAGFREHPEEGFDVVIDARGFPRSLAGGDKLYSQLVEDAIASETRSGAFAVTWDGQVTGAQGPRSGLYALGHPASGSHPFISNLEWLVETCDVAAASVASRLSSGTGTAP